MAIIILLLTAYTMGFLVAIPVGAVQIEIAKRALNHKLLAAAMVAIGAIASDVMYGAIALFGVAPLLRHPAVIAIFDSVSVVILWALAFYTFKESGRLSSGAVDTSLMKSKRFSFFTGLGIAIANPMMIFWWLLGVRFSINSGLTASFSHTKSLLFLVFGGLGLASYLLLLAATLYKIRAFISVKILKHIYKSMEEACCCCHYISFTTR